jgi:hypothetical protein
MQHNATCARCGQRAPIVLRGIEARCTACGALRIPFTAKALNLAGKPSRFGGAAARFLGWGAIAMGTTIALSLALIIQSIFAGGYVGWAVALPVAVMSWLVGLSLVFGGRKLSRSGDEAEREARMQAVRALAAHLGGSVTADVVARKLEMAELEADALLTELAKTPEENVALEIDDDGGIHYLFGVGGHALRFEALSDPARSVVPAPVRIETAADGADSAAEQRAAEEQAATDEALAEERRQTTR